MTTSARAPVATITPGKPLLITESPAGENRWGFHQFPDIWRAPAKAPGGQGDIYLAVNVGSDSEIGQHEPSRFFMSRDEGRSFRPIPIEEVDQSPQVFTFSDGGEIAFGETAYIYHVHGLAHEQPWMWWNLARTGAKPVSEPITDSYGAYVMVVYRYADLPASMHRFPARYRHSANEAWQPFEAGLDAPEMHFYCLHEAGWWDEQGKTYRQPKPHRIFRPWPRYGQVVRLPDDTLLWAQAAVNPASIRLKRFFYNVHLFASTDRGRSWSQRGMIANDTELTTDGYSGQEHSLALMPNGDLFCVMRTEMGDGPELTRYLAAARSSDQGRTWTKPAPIAPFSVTPLLMALENGTQAVAYGRPGVYVRASADSGLHWTAGLPVVGPTEEELVKDKWWAVPYHQRSDDKISCGNLGEVVTGPDRFLLAYSDFRHKNSRGETCKAIFVREFVIKPG